jgi:glucan-binding YG repeat protein
MNEGTLARPQQGVVKMAEVSGNTGQVAGGAKKLSGGVYRHPQTGQEIIALDDPITGDAQARGYVRVGFEFVRDVKDNEVKSVGLTSPSEDFAKHPQRKLDDQSDVLKGLAARMNALESENAKLREQAVRESTPADAPTEQSQKGAQEAAEQKVAERGTDNSGDVAANGGVNTPVQTNAKKEAK